jgi:hypothetical protein
MAEEIPPDPQVEALAIACQRCGNVRFHVADVLEQYLAPDLAG